MNRLIVAFLMAAAPAAALAQTDGDDGPPRAADDDFMSLSVTPRVQSSVLVQGGYDAARDEVVFDSTVEAELTRWLAVRAGGSYNGTFRPIFGAKVQALRQADAGLDLAVSGGYEPLGFNQVPAVAALASVGRSFGALALVANAGIGVGLEEAERYGDARLAALVRVARDLRVGADSRFRIDLERDSDEPEGEPDWELTAGPLATLTAGRFAVTGTVGLSAIRFRLEDHTSVGAMAQLGVGAVF